jgi:hypothetical protein
MSLVIGITLKSRLERGPVFSMYPRPIAGSTARLTVSASLTDGSPPSVTVNGNLVRGSLPDDRDSTLSRQAVKSGYSRMAVVTFPTSWLHVGDNIVMAFSRGAAPGWDSKTGMGCDTVKLQVRKSRKRHLVREKPELTMKAVTVLSAHGEGRRIQSGSSGSLVHSAGGDLHVGCLR